MDDSHACFGCQKSFTTQKRLHTHEARCQAHVQLKISDLTRSHKRPKIAQDNPENLHPQRQSVIADEADPNQPQAESSYQAASIFYGNAVDPEDDLVCILRILYFSFVLQVL